MNRIGLWVCGLLLVLSPHHGFSQGSQVEVFTGERFAYHYLKIATLRAALAADRCITSRRGCAFLDDTYDTERMLVLYKILDLLDPNGSGFVYEANLHYPKFEFLSAREHPEFFEVQDGHKESSTYNWPGAPIFINIDYFYENSDNPEPRPRSIDHWARLILHELAHQTSALLLPSWSPAAHFDSQKRRTNAEKNHVFVDKLAQDSIQTLSNYERIDLNDSWLPTQVFWQNKRYDLVFEQTQKGVLFGEETSKVLIFQKNRLFDLSRLIESKIYQQEICSAIRITKMGWVLRNIYWSDRPDKIVLNGLIDVHCIQDVIIHEKNLNFQILLNKSILEGAKGTKYLQLQESEIELSIFGPKRYQVPIRCTPH